MENKPHWTDMLLVHDEITRDYIIEEETDWWVCKCGNKPDCDGFYTCNEIGEIVPPSISEGWDEKHYVCHKCWRIINSNTLEIVGYCSLDVLNKNNEFRWGTY